MNEILEVSATEEAVSETEEATAEPAVSEEAGAMNEVLQQVQDVLPDEKTYNAPDPFGPVNDGSIPLEVPAASESGYVSPYSQQSSEGINRQRTDGSGEPAGDRAGFWPRLFAFLIDAVAATVCWAVLLFVVGLFTDRLNEPFFFSVKLRTVLIYIAQKIYFVISEWRFQKTLGKKALRLKLISSESFEGPDLWTVVFRETFGKFISSVCIVGDLMILGKEHLPLYDRLADTEVVYTVNVSKTIKEEIKADPAQIPSVPAPVQEQDTGSV